MRDVQEFKIDQWMRSYANFSGYGLEGSFASALSINQLKSFSTNPNLEILDGSLNLKYNPYDGSAKLRDSVAALYSSTSRGLTRDNVVITPGSIMANFLVLDTICSPGDHIICQYPTYAQLYLVPRYSGVDVSLWRMDEENGWMLHIEELRGMIKPNTKAIILNNPNNPTGAVLSKTFLLDVIEIARQSNILVFCDEVFSPLFFTDRESPSLISLGYENAVVTGSLSKAFALPGVRVGWATTQNAALAETLRLKRDFTTICVSHIDDGVASFTLNRAVLPSLMERNLALCRESLELLDEFVKRNGNRVRWTKPEGAGIAFIKILREKGQPVDDVKFSQGLANEGVLVVPGRYSFDEGKGDDFKGYVRITLGSPDVLRLGLPILERFIHNAP